MMGDTRLRQALVNRLAGLAVFSAVKAEGVDRMINDIVDIVKEQGYVQVTRCWDCKNGRPNKGGGIECCWDYYEGGPINDKDYYCPHSMPKEERPMPNDLVKDLEGALREVDVVLRCSLCPGWTDEGCDDQCGEYDHRLERIVDELKKQGWVKVTRCGECHNWRPMNESTDGGHYCDVDLQAYGVMFNCPPDHFCSSSEPKEAEQ